MEKKKKMTREEITEFWANYTPPKSELSDLFLEALRRGIMENQREAEEAKKQKNQPPQP